MQKGRTATEAVRPFRFSIDLCGRLVFLGLFGAAGGLVLLFEAVHASSRIDQLLFTSKERMAGGADFHSDIALVRRARFEGMAAGADDINFVVSGVNTGLHFSTGILSRFSVYQKYEPPCPLGNTGAGSQGDKNLRLKLTREAAGPQERDSDTGRNRLH
jgi:hypothetical protein